MIDIDKYLSVSIVDRLWNFTISVYIFNSFVIKQFLTNIYILVVFSYIGFLMIILRNLLETFKNLVKKKHYYINSNGVINLNLIYENNIKLNK